MTEGQRLLRRCGRQEEIAARLGVAQGTVSKWMSGVKPQYGNRALLLRVLKIPLEAWDLPAKPPAAEAA